MTKDTTNTSQLSQSPKHPRQGLTKLQKDLSKRRTEHRLEHHMFFLLVFLKDKFIYNLDSLWGGGFKLKNKPK